MNVCLCALATAFTCVCVCVCVCTASHPFFATRRPSVPNPDADPETAQESDTVRLITCTRGSSLKEVLGLMADNNVHRVRQTYGCVGRQPGRQSDRQTDRQTDRQADGQTGRQTDRQAGRQDYTGCALHHMTFTCMCHHPRSCLRRCM